MMRHVHSTDKPALLSLCLVIAALDGCALMSKLDLKSEPEAEMVAMPQETYADNYEVLVKESRAEAERLRSELAAMKIAAAKQNADLQFSQGTSSSFLNREEELASEVHRLKGDVSKLEAERDQLRRQNVQLQAHSAALPGMRQLVMDIKALQTSVHQLVTKMETLSQDIIKIKEDRLQNENGLETRPSLTKLPVSRPSALSAGRTTITVVHGDTLWGIARAHGISVHQLKEINGLQTDVITVDQQLEVPIPQPRPAELETQASLATIKGKKQSGEATIQEEVQNAKEGP